MMRSDSSDSSGVRPKKARRRLAASGSSSSDGSPPPRSRRPPPSSDSRSASDSDASSSVGSLNDGLDADLMGDSQDRERLARMTEKEREEELFKRAERREAMSARAVVKRRLKKKRKGDGEKASAPAASPASATASPAPLTSASSATSDEDGPGVGVSGRSQRKASLQQSQRHQSRSSQLAALMARRKELAQKSKLKTSDIFSSDEESSEESSDSSDGGKAAPARKGQSRTLSSESPNSSEVDEGREAGSKSWLIPKGKEEKRPVKKFYDSSVSSDLSDVDEEETAPKKRVEKKQKKTKKREKSPSRRRRLVLSSDDDISRGGRSSSSNASDSDDESTEEREQEEKHVDCLADLLKLRVSRYRLAKWVHMPFFKELVKGLFVRVGIGRRPDQNAPVYRLGEIADVVETGKVYDVEKTRTNKGLILRHAGDKAMFRIKFVSNQPFSQPEFVRWQRAMQSANLSAPTLRFITEKVHALRKAHQFRLDNERDLDLILAEKRRFQSRPRNYTIRKLELAKDRDIAELEGDTARMRAIAEELEDIEREANEIDRRRSSGIKALTYINQRNRERNLVNAEEAVKEEAKDREEMERLHGGDPFTRLKTRPTLLASGVEPPWVAARKALAEAKAKEEAEAKVKEEAGEEEAEGGGGPKRSEAEAVVHAGDFYSIHNFDLGVEIALAGEEGGGPGAAHAALVPVPVDASAGPAPGLRPKTLNLEEYKRRRNLL